MQEDEFPDLNHYPLVSAEKFESMVREGQKSCILDNVIMDLSGYFHQHTGGQFLLEQTVGRDISKFFYGGYQLDGNLDKRPGDQTMAHPHSNIARKIAYKHIVGVIEKREIQENIFKIDES